MHICMLSDHLESRDAVVALGQQGHDVSWLVPTAYLPTLSVETERLTVATDILPATCQHVIPLQAYHYQGVQLLVISQTLWQQPELHTRLFTLLCLLHRAAPYQVFHTWGPVPLAYLTVYTARFVAVPAVVSCDAAMLAAREHQPFLWDWMLRQAAAMVVPSRAERAQLVSHNAGLPVSVLDTTHPALGQRLTALYAGLGVC